MATSDIITRSKSKDINNIENENVLEVYYGGFPISRPNNYSHIMTTTSPSVGPIPCVQAGTYDTCTVSSVDRNSRFVPNSTKLVPEPKSQRDHSMRRHNSDSSLNRGGSMINSPQMKTTFSTSIAPASRPMLSAGDNVPVNTRPHVPQTQRYISSGDERSFNEDYGRQVHPATRELTMPRESPETTRQKMYYYSPPRNPDEDHSSRRPCYKRTQPMSRHTERPYSDPDRFMSNLEMSQTGYQGHLFARPVIKTPHFSGKGNWDTFIKQFTSIAVNNRWSDQQKLGQLLGILCKDAADFDLPPEVIQNFEILVYNLEQRFRIVESRDSLQHQFHARKLKDGESIRQFAATLKSLFIKAFPSGVSGQIKEEMLMKQFFDGLYDADVNFHVKYLKHPMNIDQAVSQVEEYNFYAKGPSRKKFQVRTFSDAAEENEDLPVRFVKNKHSPEYEELKKLSKGIADLTAAVTQLINEPPERKFSRDLSKVKCYSCNNFVHYSRTCPEKMNPSSQKSDEDATLRNQKQEN